MRDKGKCFYSLPRFGIIHIACLAALSDMEILLATSSFSLGPLWATLIIGLTTLAVLYWYSSSKLSYWKKRKVPYIKPSLENLKTTFHDIELKRYQEIGRIYGHYEGIRPLISVAEPELVRSILIKDFSNFTGRRQFNSGDKIVEKMLSIVRGDDWKRIRTIVTPTFTTGKIKRMLNIFKECSQSIVENFRKVAEEGNPVEAKSLYGAFTMDIIASSAFSTKIDSHNDPNNPFVACARKVFSRDINWRFVLFTLMPGLAQFFRISVFSEEAMRFFSTVTLQIIEERKKTGQRRNDFLQLLIDTTDELQKEGKLDLGEKDEITEMYGKVDSDVFKINTLTKKTLSHDELIAQCVIFFLAGYDTTASTLSFASYLLALNPDHQEKLIQEVDKALKKNNGELSYEAVQSMKYLDNVIAETLRLYPPAVRLERIADEDYKLGDTGIIVPKDMIVTIPVYAIHHDPKHFPDPEKFDPDRFTPEERAKRHQFAYLPFGAGPRNCVAMRFALMEVKVCLAHVISNFRLKRCSETKVPLEWYRGLGLLQPKDVTFKLEIRKDAVTETL